MTEPKDIVERWEQAALGWHPEATATKAVADLIHEITRLREENERLQEVNMSVAVCARHTAEIVDRDCVICEAARYREALEQTELAMDAYAREVFRLHGEIVRQGHADIYRVPTREPETMYEAAKKEMDRALASRALHQEDRDGR